jgi:hypothetical protein
MIVRLQGLYSVWDENHKGGPIHVLECNGQAIVGCLAKNQNYLIVGGTSDGSILLWDLRENSSFHRDKDSIDLKITSGIRKPAFVSSCGRNSYDYNELRSKGNNNQETEGDLSSFHFSAVKRIECLDNEATLSSSSSLAQFVSIDETGLAIFWITSESSSSFLTSADRNLESNINMRLGSKMMLIKTRQLHVFHSRNNDLSFSSSLFPSTGRASSIRSCSLLSGSGFHEEEISIGIIPNDASSFVVSCSSNLFLVSRVSGSTSEPMVFTSSIPSHKLSSSTKSISSLTVLSMNLDHETNKGIVYEVIPPLFIVGRNDCTLELFRVDQSSPIHSWSITPSEQNHNDQKSGLRNHSVSLLLVKGIRNSFCFFVIASDGMMYYFDLVKDFYHPLLAQSVVTSSTESEERRRREHSMFQKGSVAVSEIQKAASLSDGKLVVFTGNSTKGNNSIMKIGQIASNCFPQNRKQLDIQGDSGYNEDEMKLFFEKINKHKPLTKT